MVTEFRILGPLQVLRDGVPLVLGGTLQRSVLARLLLDAGRVVRAETLIDDVWAGRPPPTAGKTLQKYISGLRKIIGRSTLRTVAGGYAVDVAGDVLDSRRFEECVTAGAFVDAIALWRGDVLADLPECGFAVPERRRLEDLYLVAVEGRMRDELAGGRHAEAVGDLEVLVAAHPLRERLVAMHMLALYRSGRPVEAVRAYERHRRRLAEDVGMVPASELRELEAAMLRQDPALELDAAPPAATTASRGGRPPAAPRSPMPLPRVVERYAERPFVGRDAALQVLRESWQAAVTGDRRLVAITGEDGIGKTRLAARFAVDAHDDGAIVLWGRATPGPIVPYEPIVGALRTALRAVSPEARRRVVEGRPALGVLIPDLDDIVPGAESMEPADGMERFVIYETIAELLEAESDSWPILFVIDDLQWADEGSLRLIDHVIRHERPARVLLVATLRTLPTIAAPGVDGFLADLHRDGVLTRLELGGLETDGVTELLEASGWHDARAAADSICRATGGNPFFVTELAEHGQRGPAIELPSSLRDVLHRRLDRLDSNTNRLAAVAALAGPAIPLPVLGGAAALSDDQLLDAVDHGRAAGVLVEDVTAGGIGFRHSLVQQAALERLSRSRRATLHLTLARVVASSEGCRPADLAHHLLAAGVLAPADATVEAVVAAGRGALEVLAHEEAARWASSALGITGAAGRLRCESLLLQSDALRALGRRVDAREVARQAASLARELKDPLLLARAAEAVALARAGLGFDFGTCDPELDLLLEEALEALPAASTDYRARLLGASLSNAAADGDRAAVTRLARTATRLDGDTDQPALVATAQLAWRMANWRRDLLDDRLTANTAAWNNARRAGNTALELNALLYGLTDLMEAGRMDEADAWFDEFRTRAGRLRQPVYDSFTHSIEASNLLLRGEYAASAHLAERALNVGRESHGMNAVQAWMANVLTRAWDHGTLGERAEHTARAVTEFDSQPTWRIVHGAAQVAAGDIAGGAAVLTLVGDDHVDVIDDSLWGVGVGLLVEIARVVGDRARARVLMSVLEPYVGRFIVAGLARASLGPIARYAGVAAHVAGDLDAADRLLARAEHQSRQCGARPHLARALHDRSLLLADRPTNVKGTAEEAMAQARHIAAEIGLVLGDLTATAATPSMP